ncbi:hypothetical protein TNCV_5060891 [Trichonephila clavipes]|nr:hypothetical protein TNCV_5060891 [Trichonephila clavipes]
MSAETTKRRAVRCFSAATDVSYTSDLGFSRRNSRAWRLSNRSATSNLPPEVCSMEVDTHLNRKMGWYTILHKPHVLECSDQYSHFYFPQKEGKVAYVRFLQPYHGTPNLIQLAIFLVRHRPPYGYYYPDFHQLNLVCDPMFYVDLSSPSRLLTPL